MLSANRCKCLGDRCIRNVRAIPGYQEIHSVQGCDGNVRSIGSCLARDYAGTENTGREFRNLRGDIQQWKILQHLQSLACCDRVSRTYFVNDKLRDVKLESTPTLLPPFPGERLVARNDQIPARPRGQVARNGRPSTRGTSSLDVNRLLPPLDAICSHPLDSMLKHVRVPPTRGKGQA